MQKCQRVLNSYVYTISNKVSTLHTMSFIQMFYLLTSNYFIERTSFKLSTQNKQIYIMFEILT